MRLVIICKDCEEFYACVILLFSKWVLVMRLFSTRCYRFEPRLRTFKMRTVPRIHARSNIDHA